MNQSLKIPESYKTVTTVAIKGISNNSDIVICTTDKRLMGFLNGCLVKKCDVKIEVKHLEPYVIYEPTFDVYYILHGDNTVVIVKEGTTFEIIKTYYNVYEMAISDHNNSGVPQLYLRTIDQGFKCIDIYEELGQISSEANQSKFLETSVVYTYCANKLQQLQLSYDTEKNKILQQSTFLTDTMMQVSFNMSDSDSPPNLVTKNSWLKLSNENLVYGFTLQNTSKFPIPNFNLILLGDKEIWSRFRYECWAIKRNERVFDFHSGFDNNCTSNNINKTSMNLNPESSIIVASIMDDWSFKPLPYFINGLVYINSKECDKVQYTNTDKIMVTSNLFLDKEFNVFIKNSVFIEDLVTLHCTKLLSCYQIKCIICFKDLKDMIVKNFKFDIRCEWLVNSSISWLRTIICCLDQISPLEYLLKVFSDSLVCTKTFIQVLSAILPDHSNINNLDSKKSTDFSIDEIKLDLIELRRVLKEYAGEQIIIPRNQWNDTRLKLSFT